MLESALMLRWPAPGLGTGQVLMRCSGEVSTQSFATIIYIYLFIFLTYYVLHRILEAKMNPFLPYLPR